MPSEALSNHHEQHPSGTGAGCPFHHPPAAASAALDPAQVELGAVARALVAYLAEGLARYRALVCLLAEAPAEAPADRMQITVEAAADGDLHLGLHLPGADRLRLDLIDLGIYRLLGDGLPLGPGLLRLVPLPSFARLTAGPGFLRKDIIYRLAPALRPDPDEVAMGG